MSIMDSIRRANNEPVAAGAMSIPSTSKVPTVWKLAITVMATMVSMTL